MYHRNLKIASNGRDTALIKRLGISTVGENTSILIAITACQGIGRMVCWNNGTLGNKNGKDHLLIVFLPSNPIFHHSNCKRSELSSERKQSVEERLGIYAMNPLA